MIRYLCRKPIDDIQHGQIVHVDFSEGFANLKWCYNSGNCPGGFEPDITITDSKEFDAHFVMYDGFESINAIDAMEMFVFMYKHNFKEKNMLGTLKAYAFQRQNFLKECKKESTQTTTKE